ncbi:MAG: hypothetical protein LBC75_05600 [Fibromonadaceae bacterium]|nr:hypothetical protein [Fibromonadaceae bacterium]
MDKESEQLTKEIRQLLKETAAIQKKAAEEAEVSRKEAEARQKEAEAWRKKVDEEAAARKRELDRVMQEVNDSILKVSKQMGGIDENQGHHAEQFFQSVFKKKLEFGRIKYDEMIPNLTYKGKKCEIEFDIALVNGDSIALIEVKNRIHPDFVEKFAEERVEKFREFFREFDNYDVYLGIAGFSFSNEVLDRASKYGIGIIRQVGEGVEVEANNLKVY